MDGPDELIPGLKDIVSKATWRALERYKERRDPHIIVDSDWLETKEPYAVDPDRIRVQVTVRIERVGHG
jgi:hypothetical protein